MCLNPIKIKNPKKCISLAGGDLYEMEVPCGQCAECQERKKSEWYFRCYYEAQSAFDAGGFVYFDTLTYANEHLPHINDYLADDFQLSDTYNYPCFNHEDFRYFFVRLRRRLDNLGYNVKDNLKYFLTSEYGTSDNGTHRPHYHVLFFCKDATLDPLVLSSLVNECWQKGRTDGIDYHPSIYVMNHVFGRKYNVDVHHMQMVCNYVAKYVTKDSEFSSKIESRLDKLFTDIFGEYWKAYSNSEGQEIMEMYKLLKRCCLQFNRQSHGFGDAFLKYNKMTDVIKTGMISMPDKDNISKHIPLPMYYSRKLFYDIKKDAFGRRTWHLNDLGKSFKLDRARQTVDMLTTRFEDWLENMGTFNYYHDSEDKHWYQDLLGRFLEMNNGRPMRQFAEYLVYYKGRVKSPAQLVRESMMVYRVDDAETYYRTGLNSDDEDNAKLYNYTSIKDEAIFGNKFFSDKELGDLATKTNNFKQWSTLCRVAERYLGYVPYVTDKDEVFCIADKVGDVLTKNYFERKLVNTDKCDERFFRYDHMWLLYCTAQMAKNEYKQKKYEENIAVRKRLKDNGMYVKNI